MARNPKGTYVRDTADWFQHPRARASCIITQSPLQQSAIGLFNADQQSRICHLLGVNIYLYEANDDIAGLPFGATYYGGSLPALDPASTALISATEPFFDLDGAPNVVAQAGGAPGDLVTVTNALLIAPETFLYTPAGSGVDDLWQWARYYPPGGLAAFKQGRGFAIYTSEAGNVVWSVSFDFELLPD